MEINELRAQKRVAELEKELQLWKGKVREERVKGQLMLSKLKVRLLSQEHLDGKDQSSREFLGLIAEGLSDKDSRDLSETNSHDTDAANHELASLSKK